MLALSLIFLLPAQDPQTTATLVPLLPLLGRAAAVSPPHWDTLLRFQNEGARRFDLLSTLRPPPSIAAEHIVAMLQALEHEAVATGQLELDTDGADLLLSGDPAVLARVRKLVDDGARVLARPIAVEFAVWDATDRETPPTILDAAAYASFAANRAPLWRCVGTGRSGDALALERMRWSRYTRGVQVLIAPKQVLPQPELDSYADGCHAVVRPFALHGGDELVLHTQFSVGVRRGALRTLQTGMPSSADLDMPTLETFFGACSARIPNGGVLAATLRGNPMGGGRIIVTIRAQAKPRAALATTALALLPCGALVDAGLTARTIWAKHCDYDESRADLDRASGHIAADHLLEFVRSQLRRSAQDDALVFYAAGHLVVRGPAAATRVAEQVLVELQSRLLRNVTISHAARLEPLDQDSGATTPPDRGLHELLVPTLLGRELAVARLLETTAIQELHGQVAAEAAALEPQVVTLQSGTWLRARATPLQSGVHLELELIGRNTPQPIPRSVMPGGGVVMTYEQTSTRASYAAVVADGQTIDHGDGPSVSIDGRNYRTALTTTLRR